MVLPLVSDYSLPISYFLVLNRENYFNNITSVLHQIVSADRLKANPELVGSTSFQLFDNTVQALTDAHLMVILNNHVNKIYLNCNPIKLCKDHARNFRSGSFQFSFHRSLICFITLKFSYITQLQFTKGQWHIQLLNGSL